jgi:hypothetical protein
VVTLALSTQTQVLLGIDGHGRERYALLPVRGWRVLLAKDLAFLALLLLLTAPLDPLAGFFSGLAALAIGHHRSVLVPTRQLPWRFTSGEILPLGLIQMIALISIGKSAGELGPPFDAIVIAVWLASLAWYGRRWEGGK